MGQEKDWDVPRIQKFDNVGQALPDQGQECGEKRIAFMLREIQNQIKRIIHKSSPRFEKGPRSQLQGGILGYLFHHRDGPVYQRDLEKEFQISRATATNTLQVMERDGLIVRKAQDRDARLKRIQMTDEAYQNHRQIEAHMDMMDGRMLDGLTDAEVQELRRLLGHLRGNLEEFDMELGEPLWKEGEPTPHESAGEDPGAGQGTAAERENNEEKEC